MAVTIERKIRVHSYDDNNNNNNWTNEKSNIEGRIVKRIEIAGMEIRRCELYEYKWI